MSGEATGKVAIYTLRVDGKYDLAKWPEGQELGLSWKWWCYGVILMGERPTFVDKWVKVYRGCKLIATHKVPEGALAARSGLE